MLAGGLKSRLGRFFLIVIETEGAREIFVAQHQHLERSGADGLRDAMLRLDEHLRCVARLRIEFQRFVWNLIGRFR